jgi:hypothetical protein
VVADPGAEVFDEVFRVEVEVLKVFRQREELGQTIDEGGALLSRSRVVRLVLQAGSPRSGDGDGAVLERVGGTRKADAGVDLEVSDLFSKRENGGEGFTAPDEEVELVEVGLFEKGVDEEGREGESGGVLDDGKIHHLLAKKRSTKPQGSTAGDAHLDTLVRRFEVGRGEGVDREVTAEARSGQLREKKEEGKKGRTERRAAQRFPSPQACRDSSKGPGCKADEGSQIRCI